MDNQYINWIVDALFVIVAFFVRVTLTDVKDQLKDQRIELSAVRENSYKKSDFYEFKQDLWIRLDEMKADFQRALDKR